ALAAAADRGTRAQLEPCDEARPSRVGGGLGSGNGDVTAGARLEPADCLCIELPLDARARRARYVERPGVDDLVGLLPVLRPVENVVGLLRNRVRGLPVLHRLVHPPAVEPGADGRGGLVDVHVDVAGGTGPGEVAIDVLGETVEGREHRVD